MIDAVQDHHDDLARQREHISEHDVSWLRFEPHVQFLRNRLAEVVLRDSPRQPDLSQGDTDVGCRIEDEVRLSEERSGELHGSEPEHGLESVPQDHDDEQKERLSVLLVPLLNRGGLIHLENFLPDRELTDERKGGNSPEEDLHNKFPCEYQYAR